MGSYKLTPLAKSDLIEIGEYTVETWGYKQAETYLTEIDAAFQIIADSKSFDVQREDIRQRLLMHKCRKHLIFFRRTKPTKVNILRILHEKRDHKHYP